MGTARSGKPRPQAGLRFGALLQPGSRSPAQLSPGLDLLRSGGVQNGNLIFFFFFQNGEGLGFDGRPGSAFSAWFSEV